jgi:hypothetical protein
MKRLAFPSCLLVLASACTGDPRDVPSGDGREYIDSDAGTLCAHPEEGCACSDEQPPIDCYLDPIVGEDGSIMCSRGTRYCRSGEWTGCESIETYAVRSGPGIEALITGPTSCNACDPACAVSRDVPTAPDLPGHSSGASYDPAAGGITIGSLGMSVPTPLPDADGDGVPDIADMCVGPGAFRAADGSCYGDIFFYHTLPYLGAAESDPLPIGVQVRTADVYFLMDTTGSMGDEIANLQRDLTSGSFLTGCTGGIIGAIRCTIPDAWFGVGQHDDYPIYPYGSSGSGDIVYRNLRDIGSSVSNAQTAVNGLVRHYGSDGPESQGQALYAIATGGGLGTHLPARVGCGAGSFGYPCFRNGTIPIVILFTDAPFHNGPYGYDYAFGTAAAIPDSTPTVLNDTSALALNIGNVTGSWRSWSGRTCGMADNVNLSCVNDTGVGDVFFRFQIAGGATTITLTTAGSNYDTALCIRNSGNTAELHCDDDSGPGSTSQLTVTLGNGFYYAVVAGYQDSPADECGDYRFTIGVPSTWTASGFPVTWAQTVTALNTAGIRVITVQSSDAGYGVEDAEALADATGSLSGTGARYVIDIGADGRGLSTAVVDAVVDLANYNRMDITARATDNAATPTIDERGFVDAITAVRFGPGSCSSISGGTRFVQCLPGTSVNFTVTFRNDIVMPAAMPQVFDFFIEVIGDDTYVLERVPVRIVVPPMTALFPASASYWRDYDSTMFCNDNERPDWNDLAWVIPSLPTGTSVRWELRASDTLAGLATATPVTFTAPPTTSPIDIGARLVGAGIPNYLPYLRVTAVLLSNAARTASPVVRSFETRFVCTPTE